MVHSLRVPPRLVLRKASPAAVAVAAGVEAVVEGAADEDVAAAVAVVADVAADMADKRAVAAVAAGIRRETGRGRTRTRRVGRTITVREDTTRRWRVLEGQARPGTRRALLSHYDIDILDTTWMKLLGGEY